MLNVMTVLARTVAALLFVLACAVPAIAAVQQQPPEPQEQFLPLDQLPPQEQYPVLPLLVGAYVFVVVVLFVYLFSLARRLTAVQREIDRLDADMKRTGRA
jgi:CcmD family protein